MVSDHDGVFHFVLFLLSLSLSLFSVILSFLFYRRRTKIETKSSSLSLSLQEHGSARLYKREREKKGKREKRAGGFPADATPRDDVFPISLYANEFLSHFVHTDTSGTCSTIFLFFFFFLSTFRLQLGGKSGFLSLGASASYKQKKAGKNQKKKKKI